jgi:hypothetical protein
VASKPSNKQLRISDSEEETTDVLKASQTKGKWSENTTIVRDAATS